MTSIVIRRLDPAVKDALKQLAAAHGRSMEAEARAILEERVREAQLNGKPVRSAWDVIREALKETGGFDLADVRDRTPYEPRVRFDDDEA